MSITENRINEFNVFDLMERERFYCTITDEFRKSLALKSDKLKEKSQELDISRATIRRITQSPGYWCNISSMLDVCKILELPAKELYSNITYIKTKDSVKVVPRNVQIGTELCRICGHLLGDGGIHIDRKEGKFRMFYVNNELVLLDSFSNDCKNMFGIEPYRRIREIRGDEVWLPTTVGQILHNIFDVSDCKIRRVPKFVFGLEPKLIGVFLQALYDDEGYLYPDKRMIVISLSNKKLLGDIKELLRILGIVTNPIRIHKSKTRSTMFYFNLTSKNNILNFSKLVGFLHPKKKIKLERLVSKYGEKKCAA